MKKTSTALQNEVIERIKNHPLMNFGGHHENVVTRLHLVSPELHNEVAWLFEPFPYLGLFQRPPGTHLRDSMNGWQLSSANFDSSIGDVFMGGAPAGDSGDYMWNYVYLGTSLADGGVGICNAPENFGKIAFCTVNANSERGDIPIVANSFTEWVARTLDLGPDSRERYWELPDFIDLGPAIAGDPYYRPIGRLAQ